MTRETKTMTPESTSSAEPASSGPDAGFVAQVASALRSLYDFPSLFQHPLAKMLAPASVPAEKRGGFLRTALMEAITALCPDPRTPRSSLAPRLQQAIRLRYVEGCTMGEVARALAVSERQAHRYIRQGEAEVAAVLWARHRQESARLGETRRGSLGEEVERLPLAPRNVSLSEVLAAAVDTLGPLLEREGTRLEMVTAIDAVVRADSAALQQCLTALISYACQCSRKVCVGAERSGREVCLQVDSTGGRDGTTQAPAELLATARALATAIGALLQVRTQESRLQVRLHLPLAQPLPILVIDDNEGLLDLFERYISLTDFRVIGASTPEEGLRLAHQAAPVAIVLDILMPGTDGWAVLKKLKSDPATAAVPVIVCSVFNDPHLAQALGAAAFIAKPVSQADLLGALATLRL